MQSSNPDPEPSFSNILVASDFSDASQAAFQTALSVCGMLGAKLTILHVFECAEGVPPDTTGRSLELDKLYAEAQIHLDGLTRITRIAGVSCGAIKSGGHLLAMWFYSRYQRLDIPSAVNLCVTNETHDAFLRPLSLKSKRSLYWRKIPQCRLTYGHYGASGVG